MWEVMDRLSPHKAHSVRVHVFSTKRPVIDPAH